MGKNKKQDKIYYVENITVPIYDWRWNLIFSNHPYLAARDEKFFKEYADQFYGGDKKEARKEITSPEAFVIRLNKSRFTIMVLRKDASPAVIAHEAFHLTMWLARDIGLIYSKESEESLAYLLDWFVTQITTIQKSIHKTERKK